MGKIRRMKETGTDATYHCMARVVNGNRLFKEREKEMLRKMIWQVADFSGALLYPYGWCDFGLG